MITISYSELVRCASFGVDHNAVLFRHAGELYRAFNGEVADRLNRLSPSDWEQLFDAGLVRCTRADVAVEGHTFVLQVDQLAPVTYPNEWPSTMLQSAALATVRVARALAALDLHLEDAHPWNVVFDGARATFVDLGSIKPGATPRADWFHEFDAFFTAPLRCFAAKQHALGRQLVADHRGSRLRTSLRRAAPLVHIALHGAGAMLGSRRATDDRYASLERTVAAMRIEGEAQRWSSYAEGEPGLDDRDAFDAKRLSVDSYLRRTPGSTVLDLACNQGWYSRLALRHGYRRATAVDIDDRALSLLHRRAEAENLPITPVRSDIVWPDGSYGMGLAYADIYGRVGADLVMAIAILHHLCREHHIRFEWFAQRMNQLAGHALIVEFIPADDQFVSQWPLAREPWYTLDNLIAALRPFFAEIEVVDSYPAPRKMLRCVKA